jgi:hypothetical protein
LEKKNTSPAIFLYFAVTIIVGSYVVLNMFVGVFVDVYLNVVAHMDAEKKVKKLKIQMAFEEPQGWLRQRIHKGMSTTG